MDNPMKDNGWFELISYFKPDGIRNLTLKDDKGQRVFLLGALNETAIVQVPGDASMDSVVQLGKVLEDSGIKALIVREDETHFCRLRRCSPDEEKVLDDSANEEKTQVLVVPWKGDATAEADPERSEPSEPEH